LESVNMILEKDFVSGNSSPSREVATILSTDDRRYEESPNDNTLKESPSPDFHSTKMNLNSSGTIFPNPPSVSSANLQPSSMSVPPLMMVSHSVSATTAAETTVTAGSAAVPLPPLATSNGCSVNSSQQTSQLEAMVRELQKEIQSLKQEVTTGHTLSSARADKMASSQAAAAAAEAAFSARLEASINRSLAVSLSKMEQNLKKQEELMINYMTKSLSTKCDQVLTIELKRNVAETVNRALEPLKARIDSQIGHKLNNADQVVRESVYKIVSNPGFQDTISRNVAQTLQPVIAESYREVLQANLPGMERTMKKILKDMNDTFLAGTKEYEAALRGRLEASEMAQREELAPYLRDIMRSIGNLSATQSKLSNQICDVNAKLETDLPKNLSETIRKEVRSIIAENSVATPKLPATNIRDTIQGLVSSGRLNDAFQTALSEQDLSLVMFTCEQVNTTQIFSQATCPLSQSVLLSLITQLSVDIQDKTEVKFAFLEEAIIHLDKSDPVTQVHIANVLNILQSSIKNYTQLNPNTRFARNFKTLMMAANGILAEVKECSR